MKTMAPMTPNMFRARLAPKVTKSKTQHNVKFVNSVRIKIDPMFKTSTVQRVQQIHSLLIIEKNPARTKKLEIVNSAKKENLLKPENAVVILVRRENKL